MLGCQILVHAIPGDMIEDWVTCYKEKVIELARIDSDYEEKEQVMPILEPKAADVRKVLKSIMTSV